MSQHRIYIAGPMSSLPEFNHPAFHAAAAQLRGAGYIITNPAENGLPTDDTPWVDNMRRDITLMMARSNAVATLPGIGQSRGAMVEIRLAKGLGFPVMTMNEWLHMAHPLQGGASLQQRTGMPACPKCGDNRQVWRNQISGLITCHRIHCDTVIEQAQGGAA